MEQKIRNCPFCGAKAISEVSYINYGKNELNLRAAVFCPACGCSKAVKFNGLGKPFSEYMENFNAATEAWNRRAGE